MSGLSKDVRAALDTVFDPCSVSFGSPLSVVDMGLIVGVRIDRSGRVRIRMRPTSPMCTLVGSLMQAVEERVGAVAGVTAVEVELDSATLWTEAEMSATARSRLAARRAAFAPPPAVAGTHDAAAS